MRERESGSERERVRDGGYCDQGRLEARRCFGGSDREISVGLRSLFITPPLLPT